MSSVVGAIVIARNGDRIGFHQDPKTYDGTFTQTTPLGEVQSHELGELLRDTYFNPSSPSAIQDVETDLIDPKQVYVRAKSGGEGSAAFDSVIALLQGLFPPTSKNKIELANGKVVVAPLGGYQYVPVETVEPGNDRSLEPWTSCPNFEKHVDKMSGSQEMKKQEEAAEPFFKAITDFVFGRATTMANIWNIYDYVNTELMHNKTYAHRLPPTLINQARHFANVHENMMFHEGEKGGIGNIAGRTMLHSILVSLQRIVFNDDPLKFLLIETSYQPFISLMHMTEMAKEYPEYQAIPDYGSALAIEILRGQPPDLRDFLRFKFRNGTSSDFKTLPVFGVNGDIALTEFIFRIEDYAVTSNKQWAQVCGAKSMDNYVPAAIKFDDRPTLGDSPYVGAAYAASAALVAFVLLFGAFLVSKFFGRPRKGYFRLPDDDENARPQMTKVPPPLEKRRLV